MSSLGAKQLPLSHEATAIAVSENGKRLAASALGNGRTVVYDLRVGRVLFRFGVCATALAMTRDGARLVTACSDGHHPAHASSSASHFGHEPRLDDDLGMQTVRVFDLVTGKCLTSESWRGEAPLALSPDGRLLAVIADRLTSAVLVYRLDDGQLVRTLAYPHRRRLRSLAWSPDGTLLAAATGATPVIHWSIPDFRLVVPFGVRDDDVAVAFSPDSRLVAAAGPDCRIRLFDPDSAQQRATLAVRHGAKLLRGIASLDFSPDSALVVARGRTGATQLFSARIARPLWTASPGPLAFLPDGKTIAAWWCGAVWLRDAESGDLRAATDDHDPARAATDEDPVAAGPPRSGVNRTITLRSSQLEGQLRDAPSGTRLIPPAVPAKSDAPDHAAPALLARLSLGWVESGYRTAAHLVARDADGLGVCLPLRLGHAYVQIRPQGHLFRLHVTVTADEPDLDAPPSSSLVRISRWIRDRLGAAARRKALADRAWASEIAVDAREGDVRVERALGSLTITLERIPLPTLDDLESLIHTAAEKLEA